MYSLGKEPGTQEVKETKMSNPTTTPYVTLEFGDVEYDAEPATITIDDLMEILEQAKAEGATHVVGLSGNWRGGKYARIYPEICFGDDEN